MVQRPRQESVQALAGELQLPFVPKFVVLLLPKGPKSGWPRKKAQYAKDHRRKLETVSETWFDFRLHIGGFDPVVLRQK